MTSANGAALAVMAQKPIPGQVKTRLQPYLTPQQSADLYTAFLLDTLDLAASVKRCTAFLAFAPSDAHDYFAKIAPRSIRLFPQVNGDLGWRMLSVFLRLEQCGYSPIVLIGSDIPTLQPDQIEKAVASLHTADICLGPSNDGGYFLIGARKSHPSLFEGIAWSTESVLRDTLDRVTAGHLSLKLIEPCTDVDTIDDLYWLRRELVRLKQTERAWVPPRTDARLAEMACKLLA